MEILIPIVGLGGLWFMSNRNNKPNVSKKESLSLYSAKQSTDKKTTIDDNTVPSNNITSDLNYSSLNKTHLAKSSIPNENISGEQLSSPNIYTGSAYTDKYFTKTTNDNIKNTKFVSLTGESISMDSFNHNNMQPFFGGKSTSIVNPSRGTESVLDNYTGSGSQHYSKSEQSIMFVPESNQNYTYGAPNNNDFYQSRVNPVLKHANEQPNSQIQEGGFGKDGYNSGLNDRDKYMPLTVDEMRVKSNNKSSEHGLYGHEGPSKSQITMLGQHAPVNKNNPDRYAELGPERLFTTTGIQKAPELRGEILERATNRQHLSSSYVGNGVGVGQEKPGEHSQKHGEYMESKRMELGELPIGIASATHNTPSYEGDFEKRAKRAYNNNRTANAKNTDGDYFGVVGGAMGAVIAPLLDILRPTKKEDVVENMRPYENIHSHVNASFVIDRTDRPGPTIREFTEKTDYLYGVNANQNGGAYLTTPQQIIPNERDTTTDYNYIGNGSSNGIRIYDGELKQRNNDIKSSTIAGHMVQGNMALFSGHINQQNINKEQKNNRPMANIGGQNASQMYGQEHIGTNSLDKKSNYSNILLDRTDPNILESFKNNPYVIQKQY